jgi:hypothetical protein
MDIRMGKDSYSFQMEAIARETFQIILSMVLLNINGTDRKNMWVTGC